MDNERTIEPQGGALGELQQEILPDIEALKLRERKVAQREWKLAAREQLSAKGLPLQLGELLNYESETGWSESLKMVEGLWRTAVQRGVDSRMGGSNTPLKRSAESLRYADMSDEEYYALKGI